LPTVMAMGEPLTQPARASVVRDRSMVGLMAAGFISSAGTSMTWLAIIAPGPRSVASRKVRCLFTSAWPERSIRGTDGRGGLLRGALRGRWPAALACSLRLHGRSARDDGRCRGRGVRPDAGAARLGARSRRLRVSVAFRLAASELRRPATVAEVPETATPSPDDDSHALFAAFRQLSPNQRAAVYLRYQADLPVNDVARLIGTSSAAVRVHLMRGRRKLAELLPEVDDD
jgi:hypothetical protein